VLAATITHGESKSFVVRFVGRDVTPSHTYMCQDGVPEAILFVPKDYSNESPSDDSRLPMLIVTRDRQIVRVGVETNREARARDDMDVSIAPVGRRFPGGVFVTGAPVNPALTEYLADAEKNVRAMKLDADEDDVPTYERTIGLGGSGSGKMPWGALFDAASHSLPPLTSLCPKFMDAMLARQHNVDAE
jgi:NET1-associated nuclear protein 1 (U3 small nucleolar RNA-associated protein 17)